MTYLRCLCLFAALWSAGPAVAQSLQLADGRVLLVEIPEPPTAEGLRVRRLDNGGLLDLRWEHLSQTSATELKKQYDLAGAGSDELLVEVREIEYRVQGVRQTVVGRVTERTDSEFVVQQKGVTLRVPRADVTRDVPIQVPASQAYSKDEFYKERFVERFKDAQPGGATDKADKHVLLAEDLMKFRDYDRAQEHLQRAKEINNSLDPARIDKLLAKLAIYKEAAKEAELIDQVVAARSRGGLNDYEKGLKFVAQYDKEYPSGKLRSEFETAKARFLDARTAYFRQQVADTFRRQTHYIAEKKVAEENCGLQQARDYAENKMSEDVFLRVASVLRLELAEVKQFWTDRSKVALGRRPESFSYGIGSWVLGADAVVKGSEVAKALKQNEAKEDVNDREVQRNARAMRQAAERQRAAMRNQASDQKKEQTDQEWWAAAVRAERIGWLRAYYAEFGGQMVVTSATNQPCAACYGEGTLPEPGPDGKMTRRNCSMCHATKWLRTIKAY
ncbi:MAG: hypothetical protein JNK49_17165 [Planctomycetes bacterium]|nr:hypothetical protein [Planctomycetota bacterium]